MRTSSSTLAKLVATTLPLLSLASAGDVPTVGFQKRSLRQHASQYLKQRVTTNSTFQQEYYASNYPNGSQPSDYRTGDAPGQTVIALSSLNGTDNDSPVSTCPIAFYGGAAVEGSEETGWTSMPQIVGFNTERLALTDNGNVTLPYYVENKDLTKIKRVVMIQQGKPRDSWRYANLARYAGKCAVSNPDWDTNFEDYAIVTPILWNTDDVTAGGAEATDVVWHSARWSIGAAARAPGDFDWTSFKALDALVDHFFNTTAYPALTSIVIGGHSAGALLTQRWALLREPVKGEDDNIKWWVANAGSYAWPVDSRPVTDPTAAVACPTNATSYCTMQTSCNVTMEEWPYGMNATDETTMSSYARDRVVKDKAAVLSDYYERRILYSYAELDNGDGDIHCEAQFQGATHIERGRNLVATLQDQQASGLQVSYGKFSLESRQGLRFESS